MLTEPLIICGMIREKPRAHVPGRVLCKCDRAALTERFGNTAVRAGELAARNRKEGRGSRRFDRSFDRKGERHRARLRSADDDLPDW